MNNGGGGGYMAHNPIYYKTLKLDKIYMPTYMYNT